MASKNNPENRGQKTLLRTFGGKKVKPTLYINGNRRYMAATFENGDLAINPVTKEPVPYQQCEKGVAVDEPKK